MRELSYMYKLVVLGDKMYNKEFLAANDLVKDSFIVLLSTSLMAESFQSDTVNSSAVKNFIKYYMIGMSKFKFDQQLKVLHDKNLIWINSPTSISITKLGEMTIKKLYQSLMHLDRETLRPVLKTLQQGRFKINGLLKSKENTAKRKRKSTTPYVGVKRLGPHKFEATVNLRSGPISLGTFTKPLAGAKARDSYIRKHKINYLKKSI